MYGTIARNRVKSGKGPELEKMAQGWSASPPGGAKAVYVYKSDSNPDEYWVAAIFESKDAYMSNANTPQQDANFRQMRELLEADPEWHDGEIVHSFQS